MLVVNEENGEPSLKTLVMEIRLVQWSRAAYEFVYRGDFIQRLQQDGPPARSSPARGRL